MWVAWKHINISSKRVLLPGTLHNFAYLVIWGILFWLFFMHNSLIFLLDISKHGNTLSNGNYYRAALLELKPFEGNGMFMFLSS